jgi:hypothetical protein
MARSPPAFICVSQVQIGSLQMKERRARSCTGDGGGSDHGARQQGAYPSAARSASKRSLDVAHHGGVKAIDMTRVGGLDIQTPEHLALSTWNLHSEDMRSATTISNTSSYVCNAIGVGTAVGEG